MQLLALLALFTYRDDSFAYPLIYVNQLKTPPFINQKPEKKRYTFQAEPPHIGHYREFSPVVSARLELTVFSKKQSTFKSLVVL